METKSGIIDKSVNGYIFLDVPASFEHGGYSYYRVTDADPASGIKQDDEVMVPNMAVKFSDISQRRAFVRYEDVIRHKHPARSY